MELMLIILLSLCFIVLVLLVGMYHIYSKNVSLNEDVTEINTKLEEMAKNTEDTNTSATLQFKNINEKIDDTLQRNIADLQTDLDVYGSTTNSNNNLLADLTEGHSNMTSDMDSIVIDLTTIESNVLENQNTFSESLADIEQAFTNKHLNLVRDISSLDSKNAALERRFVEYKVSNDNSYDVLEKRFTELDEEMDAQDSLYATLQQKYTELDEKMDNLQMSNEEHTDEDKINVYALDFDPKKYPLVNHFKSDYIVFSGIDKFSERTSWEQQVYSEPKDYLIHDRGHQMTHIHLFEAKNGITYHHQGDFNERIKRYLILNDKFVKMGNKMFYEDTEKNLQEIPSGIRSLQSLYIPPFMDLILTDNDTNDTISLRELYPTQLFISYTTGLELESQFGNYDGNKFFDFYNRRTNVTINSHQLTDPENIKSAVGSVFLRYKYAPFSVFEFQKNEIVYWHDLMKIGIGNNNFVTNNERAIDTSRTPVIYIPIGAGIKILAVHNVKVYEVTHDRGNHSLKYDREIPLITCKDKNFQEHEFYKEYYNSKKLCFFSGENPIIARKINMTIKLELIVNGNKQSTIYTFDKPIFKVL